MSKKYLVTQDQTVDGMPLESNSVIHYTVCSTAAAAAAKTAALSGFKLVTGAMAAVRFTVTNTAANPTLNINGTGAKAVRYRNAAVSAGVLAANRTYFMVYDGTYWQIIGDLDTNTTYSAASASAAGLMSAADKTKLNNTKSITAVVQGTLSSLTVNAGIYYVPNVSKGTSALIEYWSNTYNTDINYSNYGSRYITNIKPSMTVTPAASIMSGPTRSINCGVDSEGRPYFSGSVDQSDHYRVTWYL